MKAPGAGSRESCRMLVPKNTKSTDFPQKPATVPMDGANRSVPLPMNAQGKAGKRQNQAKTFIFAASRKTGKGRSRKALYSMKHIPTHPSKRAKGYLLAALAATTYGMNPLFALPLYAQGMDPDSVLFFRYLLAVPIIGLMIKTRGRDFRLQKADLLPLACMGILLTASSLSLFHSYHYMDAGIASTLLFIYPVLVALIMALFFKEKAGKMTIFCIFLVLAGIGMLCKSADGQAISGKGFALAMTSALTYALYIVAVNHNKRLRAMPTVKLTFYALLASSLLFFATVKFGQTLVLPPHWYHWGLLLCLALLPTVVSFLATTQAIHHIGPTPTAILGSLEPVTAVFFGVVLFHESLTPRILTGIFLIIAAVTLIVAEGNVSQALIRFRKLFPKLPARKREKASKREKP